MRLEFRLKWNGFLATTFVQCADINETPQLCITRNAKVNSVHGQNVWKWKEEETKWNYMQIAEIVIGGGRKLRENWTNANTLLFPETMSSSILLCLASITTNGSLYADPTEFYQAHQCYFRNSSPWIVLFHVEHSITSVIQSVMCHATLNKIAGNRHWPVRRFIYFIASRRIRVCTVCMVGEKWAGVCLPIHASTNPKVVWAWCKERCVAVSFGRRREFTHRIAYTNNNHVFIGMAGPGQMYRYGMRLINS